MNTFRNPSVKDLTEITTQQSNKILDVKKIDTSNNKREKGGIVDLRNFKNETINIKIVGDEYVWGIHFDKFEILIYYSDYEFTYPIYNNETSYAFIPSTIEYPYYIYVNIEKAYDNIFLNMKTNITSFSGKYYFSETNKISDIVAILPSIEAKDWTDIISSQINEISDNLHEIKISKMEYHKAVIFQIKTTNDIEFTANFYKKIRIN